jgi:diguanylate cyclase (GGDEF)-like protein
MVQSSTGLAVWQDAWSVVSVLSGSLAIVVIGGWASALGSEVVRGERLERATGGNERNLAEAKLVSPKGDSLQRIADAIDQFDVWMEHHRDETDPWPKFDEFIRFVAHRCCQAVHVQAYRHCSDNGDLISLREPGPHEWETPKRISGRGGIVGHVVTTGCAYLRRDPQQGPLVDALAAEDADAPAWCFAISCGNRRLGAVVVGKVGTAADESPALFRAVEQLVNQFWNTLVEAIASRTALLDDPVSGLHARDAFLRAAGRSLQNSYRQGEPVAVAVIALERLRELNDAGRWELADQLVREVGDRLRFKLRTDDELGRFDGSRFVLLLRRVDSHLATLIIAQVLVQIEELCGDTQRWGTPIGVRCGLAGSGTAQPDLPSLLGRALRQCHRARTEGVSTASDLQVVDPIGALD